MSAKGSRRTVSKRAQLSQRQRAQPAVKPDLVMSLLARRVPPLAVFLLLGATLAVYSPLRTHPFVDYDDLDYVMDNPHVTAGINWETVRWSLSSMENSNWHPLTWLSHALDCQLFGLDAGYHHITNLLLHVLNVLLLFLLLRYSTGATGRSFLVAAIFALHPFNVETVAWIAERKNVLSMLFLLVTLGAYGWYAQKPKPMRFLAVVGAFVLALASKPMVVPLPFLLLLLDYWPLQRIAGWTEPSRLHISQRSAQGLLLEKLPLVAVAAASCVITVWAQESGGVVRSLARLPFGSRIGNAMLSYVIYLEKTFWPSGFAVFYPHAGGLGLWKPCLAAMLLCGITAAVWQQRVVRPYLAVGWLWFLGTMVPVIGIVQVGDQAMADRYVYLPLIGIFIIAAWGAANLCDHFGVSSSLRALSAGLVLVILSCLTFRQLRYWQDTVSLFSHVAQVTSENSWVELQLALALVHEGDTEAAVPHMLTAARLTPEGFWKHYNLAVAHKSEGRIEEAAAEYETAVRLSANCSRTPEDRQPCNSALTSALLESGKAHLLLREYPKALASFQSLNHFDRARVAGAIDETYRSVIAAPSQFGYLELSLLLFASRRDEEGRAALTRALKLHPDYQEVPRLLDYLNAPSQPSGRWPRRMGVTKSHRIGGSGREAQQPTGVIQGKVRWDAIEGPPQLPDTPSAQAKTR